MIGGEAIAGFAVGGDGEAQIIYPPVSRIASAGAATGAPLVALYEEILFDDNSEILWDDDTTILWE